MWDDRIEKHYQYIDISEINSEAIFSGLFGHMRETGVSKNHVILLMKTVVNKTN